MYLNILKKDLKRKKTMNIILLIFIMLSAMFMSSSVNNIIAVTSGLDNFFEKSGMADYYVLAFDYGDNNISKALDDLDTVTKYKKETFIFGSSKNLELKGTESTDYDVTSIFMSIDNRKLNYFAPDNQMLTEVEKGTAYVSGDFAIKTNLNVGDKFSIVVGERKVELEYMGRSKDALLGSEFMGNPRFLLNDQDYQYLCGDEEAKNLKGMAYYINSTDNNKLEATIGEQSGVILPADNNTIKTTYIMSMIVAALLLIVSVFLIIISFVVLKYTIGFTISEEFREIGVMKAIGIKNRSIRTLYLTKYFTIAIVGSMLGFIFSMPFSDMLLQSVSATMYLESENSILVSILCSIAVIGITLLFCWNSTTKIKKLTAIDAVRNGQTGERFKKKSIMHLSKSKLNTTGFLATNDIINAPKKYSIITAVFTILMLLIMILANTANTLNSEKLLFLLGCTKSDAYISIDEPLMDAKVAGENSQQVLHDAFKEIEETLKDNDISGKVHAEVVYSATIRTKNGKSGLLFQYSPDTKANMYTYSEGVAPENASEIAISYPISQKLNLGIGDTITFLIDGEERECIITALLQTFNQLGNVCRLHEDFDVSKLELIGGTALQIDFDDKINEEEANRRIEKLKDIYDTKKVFTAAGYVKETTGAADIINALKNMVLIITLIIVVLIAVLMERSFISSEKSEIALMKAIGFSNRSVILHHTLRFTIVAVIASIFATILSMPLTKLSIDPVMGIMGAVIGVEYEILPLEVFVVYPLIVVAITIISAFLTSIYTNTIKSSDASNIE